SLSVFASKVAILLIALKHSSGLMSAANFQHSGIDPLIDKEESETVGNFRATSASARALYASRPGTIRRKRASKASRRFLPRKARAEDIACVATMISILMTDITTAKPISVSTCLSITSMGHLHWLRLWRWLSGSYRPLHL